MMSQRSELIHYGWKRSELSGVTRSARPEPAAASSTELGSSLLRASDAAFAAVADDLAGLDLTLLLADRTGRLIQAVGDTASRTRIEAQRRGLIVGADLSEDKVGLNGIGTALEIGRGITIDGNEHFIEAFRDFSCFGVPIVHGGSKRLEGVLNVTAPTAATGCLLEGFGRTLVRQIEAQLMANTYYDEYRLLEGFIRTSRGSSVAVCALGEGTMMSNDRAEEILEIVDLTELRMTVRRAAESAALRTTMDVGHGRELDIDIHSVGPRQTILTLHPSWRERRSVARGAPRSDNSGYLWNSRLDHVKGRSGTIAVVGDTGTGRTSAATEIMRGCSPIRIEAIDLLEGGCEGLIDVFRTLSQGSSGALILDDIEVLSEQQLRVLRRLVGSFDGRTLVLTSTPAVENQQPLASVLSGADHTVTLPPLRERTAEFGALVQGVAKQVNDGREVVFSPPCLQALSRGNWPGNLAQLKKVLTRVLIDRTGSTIGVSDLPSELRAKDGAATTAMEKAEQAAILEALASSDGNKHQAAKALGISRTTLYRRLREFRIAV